jgi:hypothetical protein
MSKWILYGVVGWLIYRAVQARQVPAPVVIGVPNNPLEAAGLGGYHPGW